MQQWPHTYVPISAKLALIMRSPDGAGRVCSDRDLRRHGSLREAIIIVSACARKRGAGAENSAGARSGTTLSKILDPPLLVVHQMGKIASVRIYHHCTFHHVVSKWYPSSPNLGLLGSYVTASCYIKDTKYVSLNHTLPQVNHNKILPLSLDSSSN